MYICVSYSDDFVLMFDDGYIWRGASFDDGDLVRDVILAELAHVCVYNSIFVARTSIDIVKIT